MKKLLIILIVFIKLVQSVYAEELSYYDLDNFVCEYYEEIFEQAKFYLEQEMYPEAEIELQKLYNSKCKTSYIAEMYMHVLNLQNKIQEAYTVADKNNLLETDEGLLIQAKMDVTAKDSSIARSNYDNILIKSPYDKFAQIGLTQNYITMGSPIHALSKLKRIEKTPETLLLQAKAFYNMEMYEDARRILESLSKTDEIIDMINEIRRRQGYQFITGYDLYVQKLNEEFKLDSNKIAFSNSCYKENMQIFLDYIMHIYLSGRLPGQGYEPLSNFTNEIRLGTQGRLKEHLALRGDIGVKIFQEKGAMILTDSWLKYYISDWLNFKLGFSRNNAEQTFLSAVGIMVDNIFTGQVDNNNLYLDTTIRLPHRSYMFAKGGIGLKGGYNLPANEYWEGMFGLGKRLRYDLSKPFLQKISIDAVTYQSGYRKNVEDLYDNQGFLYGVYFSPRWYSDNTINMNLSGSFKKFSYGCGTFGGWQFAYKPHQSFFIWGASAFGKLRITNKISCELQYRYYKYANVTRNQLIFNLVLNLYKPLK